MKELVKLMDVDDVASVLSVSPHTVRRWTAQQKLRPIKLGARTLFDPSDIAKFVELARGAGKCDKPSQEHGHEK